MLPRTDTLGGQGLSEGGFVVSGWRCPDDSAQRLGGAEVFDGDVLLLGDRAQGGSHVREPGCRLGVTIGPTPRWRRAFRTHRAERQIGLGQIQTDAHCPHPLTPVARDGSMPSGQLFHRGGRLLGDLDEDAVIGDPARGDVAVARDGVPGVPEFARYGIPTPSAQCRQAVQPTPRLGLLGRSPREEGIELLASPLRFARHGQIDAHEVAQLAEYLDVEGGITQPRLGEGSCRPVDGGVLLGQSHAQIVLDDRRETDPWQPQDAGRELGVEQLARVQSDLGEAGEVLGRGMQDPLRPTDGVIDR